MFQEDPRNGLTGSLVRFTLVHWFKTTVEEGTPWPLSPHYVRVSAHPFS
jgi:hypothetical protein